MTEKPPPPEEQLILKHEKDRIELHLPPRPKHLSMVRRLVEELCQYLELPESETNMVVMAVDEACDNAIKGCLEVGETDGIIRLALWARPDRLEIEIANPGVDFSHHFDRPSNLTVHVNEMRSSGLGLQIIKRFMDQVDYVRDPDSGHNVLRMTKSAQDQ